MNKYKAESKAAQDRYKRERTCLRKIAYPTKARADQQKGQRSYNCPYCLQWHRSGSFGKLVAKLRTRK